MGRSQKRTAIRILNLFLIGWTSGFIFLPTPSHATSQVDLSTRAKQQLRKAPACAVAAKFVEAKPNQGKVTWTFERIGTENLSSACKDVGKSFEVWIWSGSFSTLSNSLVYPLSVTEPKPGQEFDLLLDFVEIREKPANAETKGLTVQGWFLAPERDALKARTR